MALRGLYLNIIQDTYDKSLANIILGGEKLQIFPPRSGPRERCPFLPLSLNTILEVLATASRQAKEIKGTQIGKEEVKLFLLQMT